MGDTRRFHLFADLISTQWPDTHLRIADVAAGKGKLKGELYRRGYGRVTAWDRRHKLAKRRPGQVYQLFNHKTAPRDYQLIVGMHPDQATDEIILYAARHRVPFIVCPCCILPSSAEYHGPQIFDRWFRHLIDLARGQHFRTEEFKLAMDGRNMVLAGWPTKRH